MSHNSLMRVLIVDDDPDVKDAVTTYLDQNDIHVETAGSHTTVLPQLAAIQPNMVILNLNTGRENGLDLLRQMQAKARNMAVITTGYDSSEIDRIVALELGADDYIAKPYDVRELLARMRAILRRRGVPRVDRPQQRESELYRFGDWRLFGDARRLIDARGESVRLTKGEYALLIAFVKAPLRALSREHLLRATRVHEDAFDRSIDVQILRLRRKLEVGRGAKRLILTERGVGYRFALRVERVAASIDDTTDKKPSGLGSQS